MREPQFTDLGGGTREVVGIFLVCPLVRRCRVSSPSRGTGVPGFTSDSRRATELLWTARVVVGGETRSPSRSTPVVSVGLGRPRRLEGRRECTPVGRTMGRWRSGTEWRHSTSTTSGPRVTPHGLHGTPSERRRSTSNWWVEVSSRTGRRWGWSESLGEGCRSEPGSRTSARWDRQT